MPERFLVDLLEVTKDGEWGQGTASEETEPMLVIRGTDFADVRAGNLSAVPLRHISKRIADRKALKPGDILIETAGGTKDQPTGRTVFLQKEIFSETGVRLTCASFSRFLRVDRKQIEPDFLFWHLQNLYTQGDMYPFHVQHTGVARFQYTQFANSHKVEFPSLGVQESVASILNVLDKKIVANRRMNETLEAMARAIFKDWFIDFGPTRAKMEGRSPYLAPELWALFPDQLDDDGKPEGWEYQSVLKQADWVNGAAYKDMYFVEPADGLPVIKIAELKNGVTSQTKYTNTNLGEKYRIKDRELLFSWSGNPDTSIDVFVWTGGPAWLNQHIFAVRENDVRSSAFVRAMLKWLKPTFAEIARNKQTTGLGHVTKDDLKHLKIVVPTHDIEERFNDLVKPLQDRMLAALYECLHLAATRDFLLPKLMSGGIWVKDAEKIAEAAA